MTNDRKQSIGGSDCAAILGLSRWKTPLQVWAEKTGAIVPEDISKKLYVRLGNKLEQTVADLFMEETGKKVIRRNKTLIHPDYDFIRGNVDRIILEEDAGLECKTCSSWKSKEWEGEEIPADYILQCYHYMAITGRRTWYIAVLIGNTDFKWKKLEWDQKLIDDIIRREVHFWNEYVIPEVMPSTVTKDDTETLYNLFPVENVGSEITLGDEADRLVDTIKANEADLKNLENMIETNKNELKLLLKESEIGLTSHYRITWKHQSTKKLDTKALKEAEPSIYERFAKISGSRVLRMKKLEEATNGN